MLRQKAMSIGANVRTLRLLKMRVLLPHRTPRDAGQFRLGRGAEGGAPLNNTAPNPPPAGRPHAERLRLATACGLFQGRLCIPMP
jgi:hypothetical protein